MPQQEEFQSSQNIQTVTYAATLTPDPTLGEVFITTLTGALTLAAPVNAQPGQILTFELIQDGTGGRVTTFNAIYKLNFTPTTTAGLRNVLRVFYDGTNWVQMASAIGVAA